MPGHRSWRKLAGKGSDLDPVASNEALLQSDLRSFGQLCHVQICNNHALLRDVSIGPALIDPGSPWENGIVESFNCKLRDELLNRQFFCIRQGPDRTQAALLPRATVAQSP